MDEKVEGYLVFNAENREANLLGAQGIKGCLQLRSAIQNPI